MYVEDQMLVLMLFLEQLNLPIYAKQKTWL